MKTCNRCNSSKQLADFVVRKANKDGHAGYCLACKRAYDRLKYAEDIQRQQSIASTRKSANQRNLQYTWDYLKDNPCIDCGESDPVVLQFDHRDETQKLHNIGKMVRSSSLARMIEEIAKCDIRCANCHFKRTAKQFGWYKTLDL